MGEAARSGFDGGRSRSNDIESRLRLADLLVDSEAGRAEVSRK